MKVLYVDNSTHEHFGSQLLNRSKTIETKTKRALRTFLNSGIVQGEKFGIAWNGFVQGIAEFKGTKDYKTEKAFDKDFRRHKVKPGSAYGFDPKKGKTGILVKNAEWLDVPIKVVQKHGRVWTETD